MIPTQSYGKKAIISLALCVATAIASPAQTFTVIKRFSLADGSNPLGPLVQGTDGKLYGTTYAGGTAGFGSAFRITTNGGFKTLHSFCASADCPDGNYPQAGLLLGTSDDFYGVTQGGGTNGFADGTIFQLSPESILTTLYSFCSLANCADGDNPIDALIEGTDGKFYGTASQGGANGSGTVFQETYLTGELNTLASLPAQTYTQAGLVQGTDGNFYGTTVDGGPYDASGTVFQVTPEGVLTTLYSFCRNPNCTDGEDPEAGLIQASDGNFYGTTYGGGTVVNKHCVQGCGTVFQITPAGVLTTLHSFGSSDGGGPIAALVQATDGNLYGTTAEGGAANKGTLFRIAGGTLKTLHSFSKSEGENPCGLMQATDGNLYGVAASGGTGGNGTIYRLSMGFTPFVRLNPMAAPAGETIDILGNDLTGTTSVTFNGMPASFTYVLPTHLYANIPAGATTGPVEVTTPRGTLSSYFNFQVLP
jgi:uncharacterized repeat protein (TIGR03803 family)